MFYKIPLSEAPIPVNAYDITRQTVWHCADERNIIVFILDGSCSFTIENSTHVLSKGDIILIPAGQEYTRRPANDSSCQFAYVHFSTATEIETVSSQKYLDALKRLGELDRDAEDAVDALYLPRVTSVLNKFDETKHTVYRVIKECCQASKLSGMSASLSLLQILLIAQKTVLSTYTVAGNIPDPSHSQIVTSAIEFIRKNYESKISLTSLCELTHVSSQHLIRLFRKELGMAPIEYINHVKILHAIELLRSSNLTVEEIAYKLGFTSPSYFIRVFRKSTGKTPREERMRIASYGKRKSQK